MSRIREALDHLTQREDLAPELAASVISELMAGELTGAQIGALLLGLRVKGETAQEMAAFARILRGLSERIPSPPGTVDTCGTGGDGVGTFNISTTTAFVVAGAGVPVAKHGNRFASGRCGSADVLEELGVPINLSPVESANNLNDLGIAFLFAPLYHPALAKVAVHRRELGVRTIFNLLGPLLNPASAPYQLIGVSSTSVLPKMAEALQILGSERAVVVVGEDGLDEVSLAAPTQAILVQANELVPFRIIPEEYGFTRCTLAELQGGTPVENARLTLEILQEKTGPRRDIVLLNAAVALYAAGRAQDVASGVEMARESLDSGAALAKLLALRSGTSQVAGL